MLRTRRDPLAHFFGDFNRVQDEITRLFGNGATPSGPALNVWADENAFHAETDLPGIDPEAVEIIVTDGNQLTIRGERKGPEHGQKTWYDERAYGSFQRTVMLTEAVDAESIEASLADGMLSITVAKRPEAKPQKITVKAQGQDQRRLSEN